MIWEYLKLWRLGFIFVLFFGVFLSVYVLVWEERGKVLAVHFLDIGQGDAIFIVAPNGNQILIDGGPPSGAVERALAKVMPFYDRSIDLIIATHPDQDHIGGLVSVLKHYKIGAIFVSGATSTTPISLQLDALIVEKKIPKWQARRSMQVLLSKDINLSVLYPLKLYNGEATNSSSIVSRLVYGGDSYLFMADAPAKVERELIYREGKDIQSHVLKAGHHGSNTSSDQAFLSIVSPFFTVVSSGKNNRYRHPNREVLDRLLKIKTAILRTDEKGTITFTSEGKGVFLKI